MTVAGGPRALLLRMFREMVVAKDAAACPRFYHPRFALTSNGVTQGYAEFAAGHERVYATDIRYDVEYDELSWVETPDRVACRLWITTSRPDEQPVRIEVVLIATVADGLIHRLWELTWPDWSGLPSMARY